MYVYFRKGYHPMKKITKLITLSLLSFGLIGCSRGNNSSISSSVEPVSDSTSSKPAPVSSKPAPVSSSNKSEASSSSSSAKDIYDTPWSSKVVDQMVKYLGGNVLPYVNLGKGIGCSWNATSGNFGQLEFDEIDEYTTTLANDFKTAFQDAGYAITSGSSNTYTATNATLGVTATLSKKTGGTATLVATYDEPFDVNDKTTDWAQDIKDDFKEYLGAHSVPYVYIGTSHPTAVWNANTFQLSIYGGKWNSAIVTKAEAAFKESGYELTKTNDNKTLTSTINFQDGCKMQISIYASGTNQRAMYGITFTQVYDPSIVTDWDKDTKDEMATYLHKHYPPVIYLGLKVCTTKYTTSTGILTITGGAFNPLMIQDSKKAFEDDEWTILKEDDTAVYAQKEFKDGCRVHANLKNNKGIAILETRLVEGFSIPDTQKDWDEDTKKVMNKNLDNHPIPFFYMGLDEVSKTWYGSSRYLEITGDIFNEHMIDEAKKAFDAAGWTTTLGENSYGYTFSATITEEDGDVLTATMNAVSTTTKAKLKIEIDEAFAPLTGDDAKWDDNTEKYMKTNFHGFVLPYVYLGTKNVYSSYSSTNSTLTLTGATWDDSIFTLFTTALSDDETKNSRTWTVTDETDKTYGAVKAATYKNDEDNYSVSLKLYKNLSDHPTLVGTFSDVFEIPEGGAWSDETITTMRDNLNGNTIPYIYLGSTKPSVTTGARTSLTKYIQIKGGKWNNKVISLAKAALVGDGFETFINKKNNTQEIQALKTLEDGSQIRVEVFKSASAVGSSAALEVYWDAAAPESSSTEWDTATKTALDSYLGTEHSIPHIDLGASYTVTPKEIKGSTVISYSYNFLKFTNVTFTSSYITKAQKTLEADGWNVTQWYTYSRFSGRILAQKTFDDGFTVRISLYSTGAPSTKTGSTINMYVSKYNKYDKASQTAWSQKTLDYMTKNFNGETLPYIYLGAASEISTYDSSSKVLKIAGETWSDTLLDDAKASLLADKTYTWTFNNDYYNGKERLLATGVNNKTGSSFSFVLYNYGGDTNIYSCNKPYMEVRYSPSFVNNSETQWDNNTLAYMQEGLNDNIIPFFYIGENIKCTYALSNNLTLTAEGWNDVIFENCESALKADTENTWTITYDPNGDYGKTLYANCVTKDGGHLSIKLYHYNYTSSSEMSGSTTKYNQAKVEIGYTF